MIMIVIIFSTIIMSYIIGSVFKSRYFLFLDITIILLILFCFLYKTNKELRAIEYYKYHIGIITCDEYYRRHLYDTMWHIYGEAGMTEEELMKYREENKDKMVIDGMYKF